MSARKAKSPFAPGDVVCMKGQTTALTVMPSGPEGSITKDGWIWVGLVHATGFGFFLLPIVCLRKVDPPSKGRSGL